MALIWFSVQLTTIRMRTLRTSRLDISECSIMFPLEGLWFIHIMIPCSEVMLNILLELVPWLRKQYDSIQGESDEAEMARLKFLLKWGGCLMMIESSTGPK